MGLCPDARALEDELKIRRMERHELPDIYVNEITKNGEKSYEVCIWPDEDNITSEYHKGYGVSLVQAFSEAVNHWREYRLQKAGGSSK